MRLLSFLVAALLIALGAAPSALAQRNKPPVPDLTAGGETDGKHDWNLGPTGARGWMWGWKLETREARQVLITTVAARPRDLMTRTPWSDPRTRAPSTPLLLR